MAFGKVESPALCYMSPPVAVLYALSIIKTEHVFASIVTIP